MRVSTLTLTYVAYSISLSFAAAVPHISDPLIPATAVPGAPAFVLTVNGTGFSADSTVHWNGSARTTTFVSSSQLKAAILASDVAKRGVAAISVSSLGSVASNTASFEITTASAVAYSLSVLRAHPAQASSSQPRFVYTGDLNNDGKVDLIVADDSINVVSVLLGNGSGSFKPRVDYAVGTVPGAIGIGDVNGDGIVDLVVADQNSDQISVLIGIGDGSFQPAVNYDAGVGPWSIAIADFNGDGHLDVAVANYNGGYNLSILLGKGDGSFQAPAHYGADLYSTGIAAGDFNGDGVLDLATSVSAIANGHMSVFLGNGDGTFRTPVQYTAGQLPQSIASADINGDGRLDIVVTNEVYSGSGVSVFIGDGDGTFQPAVGYGVGQLPYAIAVTDLNGDGIQDLVTANNGDGTVSVLLGKGDGTFQTATNFAQAGSNGESLSLALGDFNRDGRPDIVVANGNGGQGTLGVMLGTTVSITPLFAIISTQKVGTTSPPMTFTLHNLSSRPVTVSKIAIAGANASEFNQTSACVTTINAGASCNISVTFTPLSGGPRFAVCRSATTAAPAHSRRF